ncbi:PucR family transcriptional regulator [Pectinatus sottacetonis]|uniref:PucR family transcriptional regulator n=1 Tax=Pectinatus sottacetonis TaxID=1002795 RepID=UPI0018C475D9
MLQIKEVINLTIFKNFKLVAGKNGLENTITNIDILEYEWFNNGFDVFHAGNFIMTSLFFAKDNPLLIEKSFARLIEKKISGIAVKTVFFQKMPLNIINMANDNNVPLFLFSTEYMEDIIIAFNELLKSKQNYLLFEEKIYELLTKTNNEEKINSTAREINPHFKNNLITFYLTFHNKTTSPREILNYLNRLFYKQYRETDLSNISLVKYKSGLIIFYTFSDNDNCLNNINLCHKILQHFDISPDLFRIGISNKHKTFTHFDQAIQESIYANQACYITQNAYVYYYKSEIYLYLLPLLEQSGIRKKIQTIIKILSDYDKKYTSSLLQTLICYVKNNGEIAKTATELFQHPNTIRYRLQKSRDLLHPHLGNNDFYEQIFIIFNLYLMQNKLE